MSFDAGDIQARATLDTRPFMVGARRVREEGRKLALERWNVRVGIDPTAAETETDRFKARLKTKLAAPTSARITADTTEALLKIKPLTDKLDEIQRKVATARVRLDGNEQAKRQLDQLDFHLRRVGLITSRPRVSLGGIDSANLRLDELAAKLALVGHSRTSPGGGAGGGGLLGSLSSLGGHAPGGLGLAIGAGLPLIAPVAGLAAGAASSLLTPAAAAGIGGGLFAATAKSTYGQVGKDLTNLLALQKRYNAATSDKTRIAALQAEKKAWGDLSPAERKAVTELHQLHDDWTKFQKQLHPQTFKLLSTGLDIARKGLHLLEPDVVAAGRAFDTLAGRADKSLSSPYWHHFFGDFLPGETHRALMTLGTDLGNVGGGLGHLVEDFAPLGHDLERDSKKWTEQFNRWTQGDGPGKFVNWVEQHGPTAAHDLEDLAKGIGGILKSLAPLGQIELAAFGPILKFVGDMAQQHPKEVEALGAAYLVIAGGLKAISAVSGIASTAKAVGALFTALRSGKGLSGVGDVLKGSGGGVGGCCCGPGGGGAPVGPGGTAKTAEGEAGAAGGRFSRFVKALSPAALGIKGLGGPLALTYLATQGGDTNQKGEAQYHASVLSQQPDLQRALITMVQSIGTQFVKQHYSDVNSGHLNAGEQSFYATPTGLHTDSLGNSRLSSAGQAAAFIDQYGTPAQVSALQKLAKTYPAVKQGLDAYAKSQSGLNKLLVAGPGLLGGVKGAAQEYRGALEALGTPQDVINKKVSAYAHALRSVPSTTHTKVIVDDAQAKIGLANLLSLRRQLAQQVTMHVVTAQQAKNEFYQAQHSAGGGMILGPGTGTSDSIPAMLSNGEFVLRASAVQHWGPRTLHEMNRYSGGGPVLPPWLQSGQNPSANTSSSSSSSSGGKGKGGSSSSSSKPPTAAAIRHVITGIVDYAGLTFLDDLKSTEHAIKSGIRQMIDRLNNAVADKYLKTDKSLVKQLRGTRGILVALAQQETIVGKALSAAQQTLANLRGQASSVRSGTLSTYQDLGDVGLMPNVTSVAGILSVEGKQAGVARAFSRNLGLLRKEGLSKTEYNELLAEGPGQVGNQVALLAHATPSQVRQFNRYQSTLSTLGRSTGSASASYLYGGQIRRAQHEVHVDRRLQHDLVHSQRRVADALEKYLAAGLGGDTGTHKRLDDLNKALNNLPHDVAHAIAGALDGKSKAAASHHRSRPSRSNA